MIHTRKNHWEKVYHSKKPDEVSWYQLQPTASLELIASIGVSPDQRIIDVGGGASVLVDKLLGGGFRNLTVLDISSSALDYAKERLGECANKVKWIETDVTNFNSFEKYDLWHDRAVFHFLTDPGDRKKYVKVMNESLNPGGHVIIAAFALEGPPKCSGLDVERYSSEKMRNELGDFFEFIKSVNEVHVTPWNTEQKFNYFYFKKLTE
jgi:ubiquinone/menaquinone biosynthesis C-methylase UbiE